MMPERWREAFLIHSRTPEYGRALADAYRHIDEALARWHKPHVAFSGGKDSTAMLRMVLDRRSDCHVYHWDYGRRYMPRFIEDEMRRIAEMIGVSSYEVATSTRYDDDTCHRPVWYKAHFGREIPRLLAAGFDGVFVGIRAEESRKRRRRITARRSLSDLPECWPLQNWTWRDVWACIVSRELPYLSIYDELNSTIGFHQARMSTFFDPEFERLGTNTIDGVLHWRLRGPR